MVRNAVHPITFACAKFIFIAVFVLAFSSVVNAATYYVSTTGNDSVSCATAQNIATPKLTIQAGISCWSGSGNTTYVRGGTYATRFGVWVSGTTGNPNTLASYPGEVVNLTRPNAALTAMIAFSGTHDVTIDGGTSCQDSSLPLRTGITTPLCGFVVDAGHGGLFVDDATNNIIIRGVEIDGKDFKHDPEGELGILVGHSTGVQILGNYIHNMGEQVTPESISGQPPGGYGIYFTGSSGIMDGNDIGFNDHFGIHNFTAGGPNADNNIMRNNRVYHSGKAGSGDADGILIFSGTGNYAYNNIVWASGAGGSGIIVSPSSTFVFHLYGNTIYNNSAFGISYSAGTGKEIINNILYQNTSGAFTDQGTGSTGVTFATNLCGASETHCAIVGNPLFANAAGNDFTLQAGSPAIDQGSLLSSPYNVDFAGNVRPNSGGAFDIGAFERASVPIVTRHLTVNSSNPNSGVVVAFTPPSSTHETNIVTPNTVGFDDGTVVSLTAPTPAGGNDFQKWQKDGVDDCLTQNCNVTMSADHTMLAVYSTPAPATKTLTVASSNPSSAAHINVSPNDTQNRNSGSTQFTRTFPINSVITLTARPHANDPLLCVYFEENTGTTAADSCRSGLSGTLVNGATWVTGNGGGHGVSFSSGSNQYVSIPDSNLFSGLTAFDVSIDVKPSSSLSGFVAAYCKNYIICIYASSTGYSNASSVACNDSPLGVFTDSQGNFHTVCTPTVAASGVWKTLRVRFSGGLLEFLVNGSVVDSVSVGAVVGNSNGLSQVAASQFGENFPGVVDNLIFYDSYQTNTSPGNAFTSWAGCDDNTPFYTCVKTLGADATVTATFGSPTVRTLTINSVNPSSGVGITSITSDLSSQTSCTTPCTLTYNDPTSVSFTAPATSGSNTFGSWAGVDSVGGTGNRTGTINVTGGNKTATVTYTSPPVPCSPALSITGAVQIKSGSVAIKCLGG